MTLKEKLEEAKTYYPFDRWRELFFPIKEEEFEGMKQYTQENCDAAKAAVDELIEGLLRIGEETTPEAKLLLFKKAVEKLNVLNEENDFSIIETGEREDLCELFDEIGLACGLDPENYGEGEGIASEWREW